MAKSATELQWDILQFLYRRASTGDRRFCTMATIRKNTGVEENSQFVLALTDDLEQHGLVTTRQNYRVSGGRLFQITALGIEAAEKGQPLSTSVSSKWTGLREISESERAEIVDLVRKIRLQIETEISSNVKRANALALVDAVDKLIEAPDPPWTEIVHLLGNPVFHGVGTIAGLILGIISILMAA